MRRLLAGVALAAIGLTAVTPLASAHLDGTNHKLEWGRSPDPTTANDGAQVWANDEVIGAYVYFADGVSSWDVVMHPANGGPPSSCHEDLAVDPQKKGYPTEVFINCPWDTTRAKRYFLPGPTPGAVASKPRPTSPNDPTRVWQSEDLGPSVNGRYTIEITVHNAGQICGFLTDCRRDPEKPIEKHMLYQEANPPRWREVFVVNEAAPPRQVNSAFDPSTNSISVTWAANPEPDVSYVVQEKIGDGKWSSGVGVPANRYERPLDQPGRYQYRVAAVRPAPTRDNGAATKRSEYVAAGAVDVAQLTPPSTAGADAGASGGGGAPDGGSGGGGAPGGFAPGDPTSPTTAGGGRSGGTPGKTSSTGRPSGTTAPRPSGSSSSRFSGPTNFDPGEAEGMGPDEGFSAELPYYREQGDAELAEDEGADEEAGAQTLAGGVVPRPRDTRQLLIFMASALTLFVFAMQLTVLLRRTRPALAPAEHYHDDFDEWLGF